MTRSVDPWHIAVPVVLGLVSAYLLLPRPRGGSVWLGSLAGAGALLSAGRSLIRVQAVSAEVLLFYAFAGIAVAAGGLLVTQKNPVRAALSFALVVLSTCGLFLLQAAPFLMAATVIVYAGAIVVTFVFVIMLAQQAGLSDADQRSREPFLSAVAGFVLLGALLYVLQLSYDTRRLDGLIRQMEQAAHQQTSAGVAVLADDGRFFERLRKIALVRGTSPQKNLLDDVVEVETHWDDWKKADNVKDMQEALQRLAKKTAEQVRDTSTTLRLPEERPLSGGGGFPANYPLHDLPRDPRGRVHMPAENVAQLGRTLFADYLLAVELAGILLLVAAVGAIAITSRRTEEPR